MIVVALLLFAPWFFKLAHVPGFDTFFAHQAAFSTHKTPPLFIVWYYWFSHRRPPSCWRAPGL